MVAGDETVGALAMSVRSKDGDHRDQTPMTLAMPDRWDQLATEANDQQTNGDQHNAERINSTPL
jgi:hypothetical protein